MHEREGLLGEIYLDLHPRQARTYVRSIVYAALWAVTDSTSPVPQGASAEHHAAALRFLHRLTQ